MRYRALPILLVVVWGTAAPLQAQTRLAGQAIDDSGRPVAYVNAQLLAATDSSFIHGTIADESGHFVLEAIRTGEYLLYVSLIGYREFLSEPISISGAAEHDIGAVRLSQVAVEMDEVSVEARRTLYEQKGNRLVINVGTSITLAGSSALDVLKRSPGMILNEQAGSLSMLGKDGVRLMVDGKLRYLEGDALISYLAGLRSDNIDSIELISSPSAEMDAEGNAGFINIVLKHSDEDGVRGSVSSSAGYGFGRGGLGGGSLDLHYGGRGVDVYSSYSFLWDSQEQMLDNYRRIEDAGGMHEFPAFSRRDPVRRTHNFRIGADVDLREKTTVGALVSGYQNKFSMDALTRLTILADGDAVTRSESNIEMFNRWRHVMGSVNLRHSLRGGATLGADLDHLRYHNEMPTENVNRSTPVVSGSSSTEERLSSGKTTPLAITVGRVDYGAPLYEHWEIGMGAKAAFSRFINRMRFSEAARRDWMSDHALSTRSVLREHVWAAYAKATYRPSSAISVEAGLRYELTDTELSTREEKGVVDRRWGSFFPNGVVTYELSSDAKAGLSFTRRVTRPAFNDLASFSRFDDPYTLFTGNPGLQPAVTDALKLDVTYRSILASLEYAREDSSIARFQSLIVPGTHVQVIFPTNFRYTSSVNALIGVPVELASWWTTQNNLTASRTLVDGLRNGAPVQMKRTIFRLNSTQNLSLPYELKLEANGFYESATLLGATRWEPFWGVDIAVQRTLPAGAGSVTFAVDDLFDSVAWEWTTGSPGDALYVEQRMDAAHRTFKLTYSKRFGQGPENRGRTTASEAESRRVVD